MLNFCRNIYDIIIIMVLCIHYTYTFYNFILKIGWESILTSIVFVICITFECWLPSSYLWVTNLPSSYLRLTFDLPLKAPSRYHRVTFELPLVNLLVICTAHFNFIIFLDLPLTEYTCNFLVKTIVKELEIGCRT